MRLNVVFREDEERINLNPRTNVKEIGVGFSESQSVVQSDYEKLRNRPRINQVILEGALHARDLGLANVYYDTTAHWNLQTQLVTEECAVYIYSDYSSVEDEHGNPVPVAGLKIGDGSSYLIDTPFVTDALSAMIIAHVGNTAMHVSDAEREFWNNKVSIYVRPEDDAVVFSKTAYEKDGRIIERQ